MDQRVQDELRTSIENFKLPRYRELPDVGLYLEQVVRYVNRYMYLCNGNEITASMVSNYVKQKIIPGPKKKIYGAETVGYLIFVAFMKSILSLDEIKTMEVVRERSYDISVSYDYFCGEMENLLQVAYGLKETPDKIGGKETVEKELLRAAVMAIAQKIYLSDYLRIVSELSQKPEEEKEAEE